MAICGIFRGLKNIILLYFAKIFSNLSFSGYEIGKDYIFPPKKQIFRNQAYPSDEKSRFCGRQMKFVLNKLAKMLENRIFPIKYRGNFPLTPHFSENLHFMFLETIKFINY